MLGLGWPYWKLKFPLSNKNSQKNQIRLCLYAQTVTVIKYHYYVREQIEGLLDVYTYRYLCAYTNARAHAYTYIGIKLVYTFITDRTSVITI